MSSILQSFYCPPRRQFLNCRYGKLLTSCIQLDNLLKLSYSGTNVYRTCRCTSRIYWSDRGVEKSLPYSRQHVLKTRSRGKISNYPFEVVLYVSPQCTAQCILLCFQSWRRGANVVLNYLPMYFIGPQWWGFGDLEEPGKWLSLFPLFNLFKFNFQADLVNLRREVKRSK